MGGTLKPLQGVRNIWHWTGKSESMDKGAPGVAPGLDALGKQIPELSRNVRFLQVVFWYLPSTNRRILVPIPIYGWASVCVGLGRQRCHGMVGHAKYIRPFTENIRRSWTGYHAKKDR